MINGAVASIQSHFAINDASLGFAVAAALLRAAAGAMTAGRLADRIGRISVMKIAAVLFFISAIGTSLAGSVWMIVLFRVVGGVGVGVASVIARPIAETSPARIRGRLGSLQQLAIVTGIFISLAIDYLLAHLAGGASKELWLGLEAWRWMFLMMAVPAVIYGLLTFTIPESPRYLVARHRIPEARKVLTMLLGRRTSGSPSTGSRARWLRTPNRRGVICVKPGGGRLRDRMGRLGPVDLPAVRRHQCDLLYSNVLWGRWASTRASPSSSPSSPRSSTSRRR